MRRRSRKLEKIIALAVAEERRYGAATSKSRQILEEQLARLGELDAYRRTYRERTRTVTGVSAVQWKDYHCFLARLEKALEAQRQIVRDSEHNLEMHRRRWQAKRQRVESLGKALEKYRSEERQYSERREQRIQDDRPVPTAPYGDD